MLYFRQWRVFIYSFNEGVHFVFNSYVRMLVLWAHSNCHWFDLLHWTHLHSKHQLHNLDSDTTLYGLHYINHSQFFFSGCSKASRLLVWHSFWKESFNVLISLSLQKAKPFIVWRTFCCISISFRASSIKRCHYWLWFCLWICCVCQFL